eukprot:CAMPEP_0119126500 /NCGR_PEP_ID=MMETSP1310-20130426/5406_1 /TAXON_ID=464262 /ORGANISM="Genus nov. species nov., Strain RCC2339" /LENGTH=320 /DNA_ID=CAMNT_0007116663 /DNA_START=262 /DNA_END=1221 /DNA_ORIENTATION=+
MRETGKVVAVKVVDLSKFGARKGQALREVEIMKGCQHRNLVHLLDIYENKDVEGLQHLLIMIMEFCDGGDLETLMKTSGKKGLPEEQVRSFMRDLASGLLYLYQKKIVHRDLKPMNLLLKRVEGRLQLKIADFGFAKSLAEMGEAINTLLGSPLYMAPEIWKRAPYTNKADLWSVGAIMFHMVTGRPPYPVYNRNQLEVVVTTTDLEWPVDLASRCSPAAEALLRTLLEKDVAKRCDWPTFFQHPFLGLNLEEERVLAPPLAGPGISKVMGTGTLAPKLRPSDSGDESGLSLDSFVPVPRPEDPAAEAALHRAAAKEIEA